MIRQRLALGCLLFSACAYPPKTYPTPEPVPIQAAFDVTWDVVIDYFAESLIPVATIEKASGIIVTEPFRFRGSGLTKMADCGTDWSGSPTIPTLVRHNVRVRGDSVGSQVRVTALFVSAGQYYCNSKGSYETDLTATIKQQAESVSASIRPAGRAPALSAAPLRRDTIPARTLPASPADTGFVGSRVDQVFFRRDCSAAADIAPSNRRLFRTEQEAIAAGYRRSRVPGC